MSLLVSKLQAEISKAPYLGAAWSSAKTKCESIRMTDITIPFMTLKKHLAFNPAVKFLPFLAMNFLMCPENSLILCRGYITFFFKITG